MLHYLLDEAVPGNKIPRVYADTGIELNMIRDYVMEMQKNEDRVVIIKPTVPIKSMLESEGYPFKSKKHSSMLEIYQKYKTTENRTGLQHYLHISTDDKSWASSNSCPQILKQQFVPDYPLKISDRCCLRMKEEPLRKWQKENNKNYAILGLTRDEGGRRYNAVCMAWQTKTSFNFQPLVPVTKAWEDWYIELRGIKLCDIYGEPYNFPRTGCKGCPFIQNLQKELDTLEKYFPAERKQCELIWGPVYAEYRRIGYRLKKPEPKQMDIFDCIKEDAKDVSNDHKHTRPASGRA